MDYASKNDPSSQTLDKVHDDCRPQTIFLFLAFKLIPILIYLLMKLLTDQYLSTFVVTTVLLASDFWVTKNIAGRQLAALRWYSKLGDDNQEKWYFESAQSRVASPFNVMVFWLGQLIPLLFWISIFLVNFVTLSPFWVFLALLCCILLAANFICFLECKGEHQQRVNGITKRLGVQFFELNQEK